MIPTIELQNSEIAKLNQAIEWFSRETGRDMWKVLVAQAKILVKDCVRATPPFGPHAFTETFNQQRKVGLAAVERDIRKVFVPMEEFILTRSNEDLAAALTANSGIVGVNKRTGKAAMRASRVNMEALNKIFDNLGRSGQVIHKVIPELHTKQRNRRGRIKKARQYVVVDRLSIDRYVREVQSHVGSAKSGWMAAVRGAGVKGIPKWISSAPKQLAGLFRSKKEGVEQSITVGNVGLAPEYYDRRQFDAAVQMNIKGLKEQAEKIAEYLTKKANARSS